ncbi:MAG: NAD(P)-dependent oxidoreductase [Candidatus Omnitrophota bacterium]|jgi:nucleoside-diphosphate-sugar epimerase
MRILITGATGFIGKHLVPLLSRHELLLLDTNEVSIPNRKVTSLKADLADISAWGKSVLDFAPEACCHLAWKGLPDYSFARCLENFTISALLFEYLTLNGCKKIFSAGTCWEYGNLNGPVKEDQIPEEVSLFASFKTSVRMVGESLSRQRNVNFIWGRMFFVYGPGQRETSLIPLCYAAFAKGKEPVVKNPNTVCDFIHVSDVALAIKALIEAEGINGVFNIGSGVQTPVVRVCQYVAQAAGYKGELPEKTNGNGKDGFWADVSRLRGKTSWKPLMPLEKGIKETIKELRKKHGFS